MNSNHGLDVSKRKIIHFGSNCKPPYNMFSNFHACDILYKGYTYTSTEHAYQAQLVDEPHIFAADGPIATLSIESFMYLGYSEKVATQKLKFWKAKQNVGILAKLLVKRFSTKNIGKEKCAYLFTEILLVKYSQPMFRNVLLDTADSYLLEFDKSSERNFRSQNIVRWGGMKVNDKIIGHNQQGVLHMIVRQILSLPLIS